MSNPIPLDPKTLAEWKQAATDMHLPPTCEQGLALIEECERAAALRRGMASMARRGVEGAETLRALLEGDAREDPPSQLATLMERADLAAEVERLRGLLREIEWKGVDRSEGIYSGCPVCIVCGEGQHVPGCRLAAAVAVTPEVP